MRRFPILTLLFAMIALSIWFFAANSDSLKHYPGRRQIGGPVPLGTNELKIGANVYAPSNSYHFGKVVGLDRWHQFEDGTIRPGALLRQTNGFKVWIPTDKMAEMLVVQ